MQQCQFVEVPQPPYSPDISPSDFFLFGFLKEHLRGMIFSTVADLQFAVDDFIRNIPSEMLQRVFKHWMSRCEAIIATGGEFFRKRDMV
jgi:hypothetical protein